MEGELFKNQSYISEIRLAVNKGRSGAFCLSNNEKGGLASLLYLMPTGVSFPFVGQN